MPKCQGKTCPISLEIIPKKHEYEVNKQTYNVRQLAQMILTNRAHGRTSTVPHSRNPLQATRQANILKRADLLMDVYDAIKQGRLDIVKKHIDRGMSVNYNHDVRHAHEIFPLSSFPLLSHAVGEGQFDIIKFLVDHGANVNKVDGSNFTPLMWAVITHQRAQIVKILLDKGANVNVQNKFGQTALMDAVMGPGNMAIVKMILAKNPDLFLRDIDGKTVFHHAHREYLPVLGVRRSGRSRR